MKISYDSKRCCSSGMCESFAPDIFEIGDDDGALRIIDTAPEESRRSAVELAIASCPTGALGLE